MYGYKFLYVISKNKWKSALNRPTYLALVKLEIPDDAKVIYPFNHARLFFCNDRTTKSIKHRCSKAKIVDVVNYYYSMDNEYTYHEVTNINVNIKNLIFISQYNEDFIYKFDEYVEPDELDEDLTEDCSNGIHFCDSPEDAITYMKCFTFTSINETTLDYRKLEKI